MVTVLDPNVQDKLKTQYGEMPLVLIQVPGLVRGYYGGPYPYYYNGFTYLPNRFLDIEGLVETLDNDTGEITCTFSDIPMDAGDLLSELKDYNYTGAPVTISKLIVDVAKDEVVGIGETSFHEIYNASLNTEPDEDGYDLSTIEMTLRAPGFIGRRQTNTIRSLTDHQTDFDATDTFYEHINEVVTSKREWGQRSG